MAKSGMRAVAALAPTRSAGSSRADRTGGRDVELLACPAPQRHEVFAPALVTRTSTTGEAVHAAG